MNELQQLHQWLTPGGGPSDPEEPGSFMHLYDTAPATNPPAWNACIDPQYLFAQTASSGLVQESPTRSSRNTKVIAERTPGATSPERVPPSATEVETNLPNLQGPYKSDTLTGDIHVKKGDKTCHYCGKCFVGGAAAVRKVGAPTHTGIQVDQTSI
ncbi:hypothetical protein SLS60_001027 [Paraconiothyrium brasiliense]|uniref:C2H2-type domain-containing protein n=1 Tax=Paraconiothyrium brasiliense TaxID=300254 RepID=A0ABR3S8H3_9PLEO